jgi:hypothetical protein
MRGRWLFLEAVRKCVPEAWDSLATIAHELPALHPRTASSFDEEVTLRAWCVRWGFTGYGRGGDWLLRVARATADDIRTRKQSDPIAWAPVVGASFTPPRIDTIPPPRFELPEETLEQYLLRAKAYGERVIAAAKSQGWADVPEKLSLHHFEWLARHQVAGWTQSRLVEHYQDASGKPDVPAVSLAITETARLIGVKLRPARGRRGTTLSPRAASATQ